MTEYGDWTDLPLKTRWTSDYFDRVQKREQQLAELRVALAPRITVVQSTLDEICPDEPPTDLTNAGLYERNQQRSDNRERDELTLHLAQNTKIPDQELGQFTKGIHQTVNILFTHLEIDAVRKISHMGVFGNIPSLTEVELCQQLATRWRDGLLVGADAKQQWRGIREFQSAVNFLFIEGRAPEATLQLVEGLIDFYKDAHQLTVPEWHEITRKFFVTAIMKDTIDFDWNNLEKFAKQFTAMRRIYHAVGEACEVNRNSWSLDPSRDTDAQLKLQIWKLAPQFLAQQD